MLAEAAGDPGPWRQQAILGRGCWDADALRDIVRDYALETPADDDAVRYLRIARRRRQVVAAEQSRAIVRILLCY